MATGARGDRLSRAELIAAVRQYALEHYEDGWDVIVEAFDDSQIDEEIGSHVCTVSGAIKRLSVFADVHEDRMLYAMYPEGLPEDHPKATCGHGNRLAQPVASKSCTCAPHFHGEWKN